MSTILIGADFVSTPSNYEYFSKGDILHLFGEDLLKVIEKYDYRIFNLETPLTDEKTPIKKNGPALAAPTSTIECYKKLRVDLLTLANNHILDHGINGLNSTIKKLNENNISYVGAGESLIEASKSCVIGEDRKIGIYACAEHEFSIANENSPGANPFDPLESFDHIKTLKSQSDKVIVLYHGGKEHYRYPSPLLQKVCRKIVDSGADVVVCQHSHCIGCEEHYKNGVIVYGQGNFIFDYCNNEYWNTSLLIGIDDNFNIEYIPIQKNNECVRLADASGRKSIISSFNKRSSEINLPGFIEEAYAEFAKQYIDPYLICFNGLSNNFFFRALNKITSHKFAPFLFNLKYSEKDYRKMYNYLKCEAHCELLAEAIKSKIE